MEFFRKNLLNNFIARNLKKPFMRDWEIELMKHLLSLKNPKKIFECGAGYGTLYFSGLLSSSVDWTSIEHDSSWFNIISFYNTKKNVKINLVPANNRKWSDSHGEGSYEDLIDYIEYPGKKKIFDMIIIDGRNRISCMKKVSEILRDKGVVVLQDANRARYHSYFERLGHYVFFRTSDENAGGLLIASKDKKFIDKLMAKNDLIESLKSSEMSIIQK